MTGADLVEVIDVMKQAGIGVGIGGGWGIDAFLGHQTRDHEDLDLGVDARRFDEATRVLGTIGFSPSLDELPGRLALTTDDGRQVDLHPIHYDVDGTGRQADTLRAHVCLSARSQLGLGSINGASVSCLTPDLQLEFHTGYEPTPKDRKDVALLTERFGLPLPAEYQVVQGY